MSLFITGDIMAGRGVGPAISNKGFSNLLKAFRNHIGEGPIISNLECPLTNISSDKNTLIRGLVIHCCVCKRKIYFR